MIMILMLIFNDFILVLIFIIDMIILTIIIRNRVLRADSFEESVDMMFELIDYGSLLLYLV